MHFAFYFNMNLNSLYSDSAFFLLKKTNPLTEGLGNTDMKLATT